MTRDRDIYVAHGTQADSVREARAYVTRIFRAGGGATPRIVAARRVDPTNATRGFMVTIREEVTT